MSVQQEVKNYIEKNGLPKLDGFYLEYLIEENCYYKMELRSYPGFRILLLNVIDLDDNVDMFQIRIDQRISILRTRSKIDELTLFNILSYGKIISRKKLTYDEYVDSNFGIEDCPFCMSGNTILKKGTLICKDCKKEDQHIEIYQYGGMNALAGFDELF